MSDLIQKKKEYLLAIPDAVNLVDASKLVADLVSRLAFHMK